MGWTMSRRWRRRIFGLILFWIFGRLWDEGGGGASLSSWQGSHTDFPPLYLKPYGSTPTYVGIVGIVRVHFAYSNQQVFKIPNLCTDFWRRPYGRMNAYLGVYRYAKCTFGSVGTTKALFIPWVRIILSYVCFMFFLHSLPSSIYTMFGTIILLYYVFGLVWQVPFIVWPRPQKNT
jgi:hypothetical protein